MKTEKLWKKKLVFSNIISRGDDMGKNKPKINADSALKKIMNYLNDNSSTGGRFNLYTVKALTELVDFDDKDGVTHRGLSSTLGWHIPDYSSVHNNTLKGINRFFIRNLGTYGYGAIPGRTAREYYNEIVDENHDGDNVIHATVHHKEKRDYTLLITKCGR